MLGVALLDKIRNTEIQRLMKVQGVGNREIEIKWSWAGYDHTRSLELFLL